MPVKFGTFVPQGWRMDLVDVKDPVEKYEHMTRFGQEAERGVLIGRGHTITAFCSTPCFLL